MSKNLFDIKVSKFPTAQITKKVNKILAKKQRVLTSMGSKTLKRSIQKTLMSNHKLAEIAKQLTNIPTESRSHSNPKLGSGIMLKVSGGKMNIRIRITPRLFQDQDAYYALMVAQYGRKAIHVRNGKMLALAVSTPTNGRKAIPHKTKPGKFVVFAKYAAAVAPYFFWIDEARKDAKEEFVKLVEKL